MPVIVAPIVACAADGRADARASIRAGLEEPLMAAVRLSLRQQRARALIKHLVSAAAVTASG